MDPILGSREKKVNALEARKRELLLRRKLLKNNNDIERIEKLLQDVEELLGKYRQPTTMRRRIRKTDEG